MTDRDVVERVGRLIERAVVPVRKRRAHHKTPYVTTIKGAPAVLLMRAIHSYMGTFRQSQIERAIASWHGHRIRWPGRATRCAASGCLRAGARRGLCVRHYDRWWKARRRGQTTAVGPVDAPAQPFGPGGDGAANDEACTFAWLTGLLEGEGTFSVNRQSAHIAYPVIKLEMCDEAIVTRAAHIMGAPTCSGTIQIMKAGVPHSLQRSRVTTRRHGCETSGARWEFAARRRSTPHSRSTTRSVSSIHRRHASSPAAASHTAGAVYATSTT